MTFDSKNRYRNIKDAHADELENIEKIVNSDHWRQKFHIMPKTGLLNDPNGLAYFNGKYHIFFQWFPFGPVHGLKHWAHYVSEDMVSWHEDKRILIPEEWYESHGAFSGSAVIKDNQLYLMYTGNVRKKDNRRKSYQCLARLEEKKIVKDPDNPVINSIPDGFTNEFRDPKIFQKDGSFYLVIGGQKENMTGSIAVYQSKDLHNWNFIGELKTGLENFGYMWECPDYFELNDTGILLFCPQGLKPDKDCFNNIYQSGYIAGDKLNLDTLEFRHSDFTELDRGFDFYAPQTFEKDGRRLMIGWMGLPEIEYPSEKNFWVHCLTIPRELKLMNNRLVQSPASELKKLRKEKETFSENLHKQKIKLPISGTVYELLAEFSDFSGDFGLELRTGPGDEKTVLWYDYKNSKIILDRTNSGEKFGLDYGSLRMVHFIAPVIKFHIFMDSSSVEIFINDGKETFTARIFPGENSSGISVFSTGTAKINLSKWNLA